MEKQTFNHWNPSTKLCYKQHEQGKSCNGCPNFNFCMIKPWNDNPYKIKNIKYAMLMTLKNIGKPE